MTKFNVFSLNVFKSDRFDGESYVQSKCSLNEKGFEIALSSNCFLGSAEGVIFRDFGNKHLCSYLMDLKKASAEEMLRSVYANYTAFIRTSKEISDLEGELLSIRNLLSTQASLIHGLAEGVIVDTLGSGADGSASDGITNFENREKSDLDKWLVEFPDLLDVLLAERRIDEALKAHDEGERVVSEGLETKLLSLDALMSLQTSIIRRRQKLAVQLAEAACHPSTRSDELRSAISSLKRLGDGTHAHTLLLNAHLQRYQNSMQSLRSSNSSYGGAYTAALSQLVFSAIAQVEFYFSDRNLPKDEFLRNSISENEDGMVNLSLICSFSKMKSHLSLGALKADEIPDEIIKAVAETLPNF
ncbi:hypothetical protein V2J09_018068 [Rumex salicifolius]